ncbi:hypothetical protein OG588_22155 [Streptomyces prunicolor]|uniref:hypothetical protein n=1 Tax=Streptomyces prunicolor TaxID=67348 RepID=UPI00386E26D2|nr:hypothetical protein OG588_22155 [Streptomyces prunicolor]
MYPVLKSRTAVDTPIAVPVTSPISAPAPAWISVGQICFLLYFAFAVGPYLWFSMLLNAAGIP